MYTEGGYTYEIGVYKVGVREVELGKYREGG